MYLYQLIGRITRTIRSSVLKKKKILGLFAFFVCKSFVLGLQIDNYKFIQIWHEKISLL